MDTEVMDPVEGLELVPAGPELAAALAGIDRSNLNGHAAVLLMQARHRQMCHEQAELCADVAEVVHRAPGPAWAPPARTDTVNDASVFEVAAALAWTRRTADRQVALALELTARLPDVLAALREGAIDVPKASAFVRETAALDLDIARQVARTVLADADGRTVGQLAARLRREAVKHDPEAAAKRHRCKVAERSVVAYPDTDGTTTIVGQNLPADRAAAVMERLDAMARAHRNDGDSRSVDQLRSDLFLDLLNGTYEGPGPIHRKGCIELTVPLTTLMGLKDLPGDLAGWGPIVADLARQAAQQQADMAEWKFRVVDDDGRLVAHGSTKRRPPAKLAAFVRARSRRCVAPGCRRPSSQCQLDHRIRFLDGGPTTAENLNPLCEFHHKCKDQLGWRLLQFGPGDVLWVSPHGHRYLVATDNQDP